MDQYLLIPFLVGWTSIYQLFWCSPGVRVLTHCLRTIVTIIASYLLWPVGFFHFRAEVLQPAETEAPLISAIPPLRSSESLSKTLWFHWSCCKDDGGIFHFIYGIYMGYIWDIYMGYIWDIYGIYIFHFIYGIYIYIIYIMIYNPVIMSSHWRSPSFFKMVFHSTSKQFAELGIAFSWCVLRREFSGMIHFISNVIIPATPSNPSIPYWY